MMMEDRDSNNDEKKQPDEVISNEHDEKKQPDEVIPQEQDKDESSSAGDVDKNKNNLYDELAQALFSAINIYGLADLRELARRNEGKLKGDDQILVQKVLTLPCSRVELSKVFIDNLSELKKVMQTDLYLSSMERLDKDLLPHLLGEGGGGGGEKLKDSEAAKTQSSKEEARRPFRTVCDSVIQQHRQQQQQYAGHDDPVTLEVFDDENSTEELVYSIILDRHRKLFKVVFRGSVTVRDWAVDANTNIIKLAPNPLFDKSTTIPQARKVGIHRGFYNYMFELNKRNGGKNKYETIHAHLERLRQEYPDFTLCSTGHSLGAALATLFVYQTAMDDRFTETPISCFAFASPRVGNNKFVRAFQELELEGKIRFLLIHNDGDVIPMMPLKSCLLPPAMYGHAGVGLRLFRYGTCKCIYPPICKSRLRLRWHHTMLAVNFCGRPPVYCSPKFWCRDIVRFHGCEEYMDRLESVSKELHGMRLRDLSSKSRERSSLKMSLDMVELEEQDGN